MIIYMLILKVVPCLLRGWTVKPFGIPFHFLVGGIVILVYDNVCIADSIHRIGDEAR